MAGHAAATGRVDGVLLDLLMAVMDSVRVWTDAGGDRQTGMAWRDAVTDRMRAADSYVPYEGLVAEEARALGLDDEAAGRLFAGWRSMDPWPDTVLLQALPVPYAFVTNCSSALALAAAQRSGLAPRFVLAAEEIGEFKPAPAAYLEGCRRLGTVSERTLMVAGSPYDAAGARAAGLRSCLVSRRDGGALPNGVAVVGSLGDLAPLLAGAARNPQGW